MSRIARSAEPLYQTRDRAVSWRIALTDPAGAALDLSGAGALATLSWAGLRHPLAVAALGPDGIVTVTAPAVLTHDLPLGQLAELSLALTDNAGAVLDFVWPVIGEEP